MKKFWIGIAAVVLVGLGVWHFASKPVEVADGKPVVKIGISLPLSGPVAALGESVKYAAKMAIDETEARDTKYQYEFIIEDNLFDSKAVLAAANKLVFLDKVKAVLSLGAMPDNLTAEVTEKNGVIHFGCGWGKSALRGKYSFNHAPTTEELARAAIEGMNQHDVKTYWVISSYSQADMDVIAALKEASSVAGIKQAGELNAINSVDYRVDLLKIKEAKPDLIMLVANPTVIERMLKQISELGITLPVASIGGLSEITHPELAEGKWFVWYMNASEDWVKKYQTLTDMPLANCSVQTYDSIRLLVDAFEKAETMDNDAVVEVLRGVRNYPGTISVIDIDDDGQIKIKALPAVMKNGKPESLGLEI